MKALWSTFIPFFVLSAALCAGADSQALATATKLEVHVRGTGPGTVAPGDPLRIAVYVQAAGQTPFAALMKPSQNLGELLLVRLHREDGRSFGPPAEVVVSAAAKPQSAHPQSAVAMFRWSPELTAGLPPGRYRVSVRWRGVPKTTAPIVETQVVVAAAPESQTPAQRSAWLLALAVDAQLTGDFARAEKLCSAVLEIQPDQAEALCLQKALRSRNAVAPTLAPTPASRTLEKTPTSPAIAKSPAAPSPPASHAAPASPASPTPAATPTWQWATQAKASSEYRTTDYSAQRATGAPDVPRAADSPKSWASLTPDGGPEWIELTFTPAVSAQQLQVVQSFNPGALTAVDVTEVDGKVTRVWEGNDTQAYEAGKVGVFVLPIPPGIKSVTTVKLTLDTKKVRGWNEIDAVGLLPRL